MTVGGRRVVVTVALAALIVLVPAVVYVWGRSSSVFDVRHVLVHDRKAIHRREVRRVLRSEFLGDNLFSIGADDVRRALAELPYVRTVAVDRAFPHTLKVRLTEYDPGALLLGGGRWYVVSTEGRVLAELQPKATPGAGAGTGSSAGGGATPTPSSTPAGMATATATPAAGSSPSSAVAAAGGQAGTTPAPHASGAQPDAGASPSPAAAPAGPPPRPPATLALPHGTARLPSLATSGSVTVGSTVTDPHVRAALAALAALPRRQARLVSGATATDTSIRLYLAQGPTVELGDTSDLAAKVLALRAVLGRYRNRHIDCTFVDVSVPNRPLAAPLLPAPSVQSPTTPGQ